MDEFSRGPPIRNAALSSTPSAVDPFPELPACFRDASYVDQQVRELKALRSQTPEAAEPAEAEADAEGTVESWEPTATEPASAASGAMATTPDAQVATSVSKWQPKRLVRTCIATLGTIVAFGPLVASRRAFVGDGQAWNRTLHRSYISTFTPILDFVHLLTYLYEASRAFAPQEIWACFQR